MKYRALILGVILHPYIPAVVGELDGLDKSRVGVLSSA